MSDAAEQKARSIIGHLALVSAMTRSVMEAAVAEVAQAIREAPPRGSTVHAAALCDDLIEWGWLKDGCRDDDDLIRARLRSYERGKIAEEVR